MKAINAPVIVVSADHSFRILRRRIEGSGNIRRAKVDGKRVKVVPYREGARQTWRLA